MVAIPKLDSYGNDNFRPISHIQVIYKIINERVISYFESFKLFNHNQFAFKKRAEEGLEKGKLPISIFLDLSKTFDWVDHKLLLIKLGMYGNRGESLNFIRP